MCFIRLAPGFAAYGGGAVIPRDGEERGDENLHQRAQRHPDCSEEEECGQ